MSALMFDGGLGIDGLGVFEEVFFAGGLDVGGEVVVFGAEVIGGVVFEPGLDAFGVGVEAAEGAGGAELDGEGAAGLAIDNGKDFLADGAEISRDLGIFDEEEFAAMGKARRVAHLGELLERGAANFQHAVGEGHVFLHGAEGDVGDFFLEPLLEFAVGQGEFDFVTEDAEGKDAAHAVLGIGVQFADGFDGEGFLELWLRHNRLRQWLERSAALRAVSQAG